MRQKPLPVCNEIRSCRFKRIGEYNVHCSILETTYKRPGECPFIKPPVDEGEEDVETQNIIEAE